MQASIVKKVTAFSLSPDTIDGIERFAVKTGRNKSATVEMLISDALKLDPPEEPEDIALAQSSHLNISRSVNFNPVILKRIRDLANTHNRRFSAVVNRLLLDSLGLTFEDIL